MTRQDILNLIEAALWAAHPNKTNRTDEAQTFLSALEAAGLIWTPENNTTEWYLLTPEQQKEIKAAKHGWEHQDYREEWRYFNDPGWYRDTIYRAKPAPRTVSTWVNVYPQPDGRSYPAGYYKSREVADRSAASNRTHVIRLDLTDGVLTTHVEEI